MAEISSTSWQRPDLAQVENVQPGTRITRGLEQHALQENTSREKVAHSGSDDKRSKEVQKLSSEELESIRENINAALEPINVRLNFTEDQEIGRMVVSVVNSETEEVIRQIPPEAMLKMAQRMEEMTGFLIDLWR